MKISGTCNVCAAPCSSCMHLTQDTSFMESKAEGVGYSENSCARKETENSLFSDAETPTRRKRREDRVPSASEASVDMPFKASPCKTDEDSQPQKENAGCSTLQCKPMSSGILPKSSQSPEGRNGSERHGDDISCLSPRTDRNSAADGVVKGDTPCTSSSTLCNGGFETFSLAKAADTMKDSVPCEEPPSEDKMKTDDKNQHGCFRLSKGGRRVKYESVEDNRMTTSESSIRLSDQLSESKNGSPERDLSDGSGKCGSSKDKLGKKSLSAGKSNGDDSLPSLQHTLDDECSAPESLEDDVKVCDICGDAGREDLLAICSRCSDGAEHTYCMRVMLDKLPEGDWLCEECSMKDSALSEAVKPETPVISSKEPPQIEKNEKREPSLGQKSSSVQGGSVSDTDAVLPSIGPKVSDTSVKKPPAKPELTSQTSVKLPETGRKAVLSREGSSKSLDSGKVKPLISSPLPSAIQPSSEPILSRPLGPSPSSSKTSGQQIQPSRGLLSRSSSIAGLKSKVKPLIENVILKPQQGTKESVSGELKEDIQRALSKSLSLKNPSPRPLNYTEIISKSQSSTLHRLEETRNQKQKKEKILERNKSFVLNRSMSSSPLTFPSISPKMTTMQTDCVKASSTLEQSVSHSNDGSENASDKGAKELKKQPPSKSLGNHMVTEGTSLAAVKEDAKTEKIKECSTSSSFRPLAPPPRRVIRCQKCNETGHSTQFCSIDKIRVSALKPTGERNSKEVSVKVNKWRDAVDVAFSKDRAQKSSLDQSVDTSHIPAPSSVSLSKPGGSAIKQNTHICKTGEQDSNSISSQGEDHKQSTSILGASRISALPEHEFIWQGSFELNRSGGLHETCEGFQAHLSSRASPKVSEVVTKFPHRVQLEEVNRLTSWPSQFREKGPTEENIALFFFAKDIKSYKRGYQKLLETMLKNDLALKGNFDGIELLIFPSNKLPLKSQRWNRLFFLWGVFRERRPSPPQAQPPVGRKPPVFDLDLEQQPLAEASPPKADPTMSTSEEPKVNAIASESPVLSSTPRNPSPPNAVVQSSDPVGRKPPAFDLDLEQQPQTDASPLNAEPAVSTSEEQSVNAIANVSPVLGSTPGNNPTRPSATVQASAPSGRKPPPFDLDLEQQPLTEVSPLNAEPTGSTSEEPLVNSTPGNPTRPNATVRGLHPVGRKPPMFDLDLEQQPLAEASPLNTEPTVLTSKEQSVNALAFKPRALGSTPGNPSPPSATVRAQPSAGRELPMFDLDLEQQPLAEASPLNPEPAGLTSAARSVNAIANGPPVLGPTSRNPSPSQMDEGGAVCADLPGVRSMPGSSSPPSASSQVNNRSIPSQMEEGSGGCSHGQRRSNPWRPDLNLESQEVDDREENIGSSINGGCQVRGQPAAERKRARSYSPLPWRQQAAESSSTSLDGDGGERKRTRPPFWDAAATTTTTAEVAAIGTGSSKVHPMLGSFQDDVWRWNASERHFFPLVSRDVAAPVPEEPPDLELALGAERKRQARRDVLPFPVQVAPPPMDRKQPKHGSGDDDLASLSLSLAFPLSSKEQQQPLPPAPRPTFFLFDRFRHG
ncbi:uncharacterized protein LOC144712461 isoform X2 [Wolffia australiana]